MSVKTVLVAHKQAGVRDRFAVALGDAHHEFLLADSEAAAIEAADTHREIHLALIDLGLSSDGLGLLRRLRAAPRTALPLVVFSGSLRSASDVAPLAAMNVGYINEHAPTAQILPALAPYLFPDTFNRRASLRVPIGVPISYRAGETITGAVTLDVAKGGLAIRTMNPLAKGTAVQVRFHLPGAPGEIDAAGHVAWSDGKVGMGVQFEKVSTNDQRAIDAFIDAQL